MHRIDLSFVSGADLEYIKKILLKFHGEWCCAGVYKKNKNQRQNER